MAYIRLKDAFEATDYAVQTGDDWQQINIGTPCSAEVRQWLVDTGNSLCAWIITAYNPQAAALDDERNQLRDQALRARLDADGHHHVPATSRARAGDWPEEPGVCITDMSEDQARALALAFDQAAIVAIPANTPAQLVWIG